MAGTHYYSTTGIVAGGRSYLAGDDCMPSPCLLLCNTHGHSNAYGNLNSETYSNTEAASDSGAAALSPAPRL